MSTATDTPAAAPPAAVDTTPATDAPAGAPPAATIEAPAAPADPFDADAFADPAAEPPKGDDTLPAGDDTAPGAQGDDTIEGDKADEGAPESYEPFTLPDGVELPAETAEQFTAIAKEFGLSQAKAQKLIDLAVADRAALGEKFVAMQGEQVQAIQADWVKEAKADPEIGGEKLAEALADAKAGLAAVGTPALNTLISAFGLAKHPEVIRAFAKIGKAVREDKFLPNNTGSEGVEKNVAKRFYSDLN